MTAPFHSAKTFRDIICTGMTIMVMTSITGSRQTTMVFIRQTPLTNQNIAIVTVTFEHTAIGST